LFLENPVASVFSDISRSPAVLVLGVCTHACTAQTLTVSCLWLFLVQMGGGRAVCYVCFMYGGGNLFTRGGFPLSFPPAWMGDSVSRRVGETRRGWSGNYWIEITYELRA
jgi:hypothetical protein